MAFGFTSTEQNTSQSVWKYQDQHAESALLMVMMKAIMTVMMVMMIVMLVMMMTLMGMMMKLRKQLRKEEMQSLQLLSSASGDKSTVYHFFKFCVDTLFSKLLWLPPQPP